MDKDNKIEMVDVIDSYPRSKNNKPCIGPCYKPNTWIVHPVTLNYVTNKEQPFCPTNRHIEMDRNGKIIYKMIDECYNATENIDINTAQMNIIYPKIAFDCNQFLRIYYKIYSFEGSIAYIKSKPNMSYYTKLRILECTWKIYGKNINDVDYGIIEIYLDIIKKKWIKYIYKEISKYIFVKNGKIYLFPPTDNQDNSNKYKKEKVNYIINKLITHNDIYKIIDGHIQLNKSEWDIVQSHNADLLKLLIDYLIRKAEENI